MTEIIYLIKKNVLKQVVKGTNTRISKEAVTFLNSKIIELVTIASNRAKANRRRTIEPRDL